MTFKKVAEIIADQLGIDESTIKPESSVLDDFGADSLDVVEILMAIEDEFGVAITDEEGSKFKTVADVVKFIDSEKK